MHAKHLVFVYTEKESQEPILIFYVIFLRSNVLEICKLLRRDDRYDSHLVNTIVSALNRKSLSVNLNGELLNIVVGDKLQRILKIKQ